MQLPFGRYRGVSLTDAPEPYLTWLAEQDWLRDPLRSAILDELERREGLRAKPPVKIDVALVDQIVRAGVRSLAKQIHPDVGGNNDAMMKVNATADLIRELVQQWN